jgi:hypothetical protein
MVHLAVPAGYILSKKAALRSGYTNRYLMYLARTGRLQARLVWRRWFIDQQALETFLTNRETRPKRGRPPKSTLPVCTLSAPTRRANDGPTDASGGHR